MVVADHPFLDARIFKKEAISLKKKGYNVTLIVPRKDGMLFDIDGTPFKKKFRQKVFKYEGIKIVTYDSESARNLLNKVLGSEAIWERQGFHNPLTQLAIKEDADIYHTHEYMSLFAGVGVKRRMKKEKGKEVKLIYDSHELTPDPIHPRYTKEERDLLQEKLFIMLKEIDYLITVSEPIQSWYKAAMPNLPTEVIYNSPPLVQQTESSNSSGGKLTVGYEGNIVNKKVSKEKILKIAELCSEKVDFKFKIIGGTRYGSPLQIPDHLHSVIEPLGWIDYSSIPAHMKDIDIGWIDLEDAHESLNSDYSLPNKLFSYLNNGIPVLVNKCHAMETFIQQHKCGYVINKKQATAEDFADALLYLHQHPNKLKVMSHEARTIMKNTYAWEQMEERLFRVYEELLI